MLREGDVGRAGEEIIEWAGGCVICKLQTKHSNAFNIEGHRCHLDPILYNCLAIEVSDQLHFLEKYDCLPSL